MKTEIIPTFAAIRIADAQNETTHAGGERFMKTRQIRHKGVGITRCEQHAYSRGYQAGRKCNPDRLVLAFDNSVCCQTCQELLARIVLGDDETMMTAIDQAKEHLSVIHAKHHPAERTE